MKLTIENGELTAREGLSLSIVNCPLLSTIRGLI